MPAYTILLMRADATDRRPMRLNINRFVFWMLVLLALGLPVGGFFLSVGWIAPNWLRLNLSSMEAAKEEAEQSLQPLQQQNAQLAERKAQLEAQVNTLRTELAEAEAKITMLETAHGGSVSRLGELEAEAVNLKQSIAKYEALLKPTITNELVQCNDLEVRLGKDEIRYNTTFSKVRNSAAMPDSLTVQVRVAGGDNIFLLEQTKKTGSVITHNLQMARSPKVAGTLPSANVPQGGLRMLDLKVVDGTRTVGYCWKTF